MLHDKIVVLPRQLGVYEPFLIVHLALLKVTTKQKYQVTLAITEIQSTSTYIHWGNLELSLVLSAETHSKGTASGKCGVYRPVNILHRSYKMGDTTCIRVLDANLDSAVFPLLVVTVIVEFFGIGLYLGGFATYLNISSQLKNEQALDATITSDV